MRTTALFCVFLLWNISSLLFAQDLREDNIKYKTIYAHEFCERYARHEIDLIVDVRTPGEYRDTSEHTSLNIGHLKNAINISIDDIDSSLSLLEPYKTKTIVLYCSHSQRSRRVAKKLTEYGYTVYSLNGGLSYLNQCSTDEFPCKEEFVEYGFKVTALSASQFDREIDKNSVVLDVRPAQEFILSDTTQGILLPPVTGAINIPADDIEKKITSLEKYKQSKILVYDMRGENALIVSNSLSRHGFTNVSFLIGGISQYYGRVYDYLSIVKHTLAGKLPYRLINVFEVSRLMDRNVIFVDARDSLEFIGKAQDEWRNYGHLKNSINIPATASEKQISLAPHNTKTSFIVFGGPNACKVAQMFCDKGYRNVSLVVGGSWDLYWSNSNIAPLRSRFTFQKE